MLNFLTEGENKLTFLEKVSQDIFGSVYAMTVEIGVFIIFFMMVNVVVFVASKFKF